METIRLSADTLFLQFAAAFALCAIACGLILAGRMTIRRAADSEKWPVVEGVVLDSGVAAVREEGRQRFRPMVRYSYEVDGKRYRRQPHPVGASQASANTPAPAACSTAIAPAAP